MVILQNPINFKVELNTQWGKETGISYLGSMFLLTHTYKTLKEAIAACRLDLDAGLFSIVVEDSTNHRFCLWCPLPPECISDG